MAATHLPLPLSTGPLEGRFASLSELTYNDIPNLWHNLDLPNLAWLWEFLILDPPKTPEELWEQFKPKANAITYAIRANPRRLNHSLRADSVHLGEKHHPEVVGVVAYLNIDQNHRALDIGSVVLSPAFQRTTASTEIQYLLLRHVFGDIGLVPSPFFRRVMWKCNSQNRNSQRAARRLGFIYEGTLRRNRLVRGHWINSDWFSIVEDEWPFIKEGLESWLDVTNFDDEGRQRRSLLECRLAVHAKSNRLNEELQLWPGPSLQTA